MIVFAREEYHGQIGRQVCAAIPNTLQDLNPGDRRHMPIGDNHIWRKVTDDVEHIQA